MTLRVFYNDDERDPNTMTVEEAIDDALKTHVLGEGETWEVVSDGPVGA